MHKEFFIIYENRLKRLSKRQQILMKIFRPKKYKVYLKALSRENNRLYQYYNNSYNIYKTIIFSEISLFENEIK